MIWHGTSTSKTSIQTLQKENGSLKYEISNLNIKLSNAYKSIDSLRTLTQKIALLFRKLQVNLASKSRQQKLIPTKNSRRLINH